MQSAVDSDGEAYLGIGSDRDGHLIALDDGSLINVGGRVSVLGDLDGDGDDELLRVTPRRFDSIDEDGTENFVGVVQVITDWSGSDPASWSPSIEITPRNVTPVTDATQFNSGISVDRVELPTDDGVGGVQATIGLAVGGDFGDVLDVFTDFTLEDVPAEPVELFDPVPYRVPLGTTQSIAAPVLGEFDIHDPEGQLAAGARIEGNQSGQQLAATQFIGNFGGDERNDLLVIGDEAAFVLFGTEDLRGVQDIDSAADLRIDLTGGWQVVASGGDIDGDSLDDLLFSRVTSSEMFAEVRLLPGRDSSPGQLSVQQDASPLIQMNRFQLPLITDFGIQAHVLNFDGDDLADIAITFNRVVVDPFFEDTVGLVFSGIQLRTAIDSNSPLGNSDAIHGISHTADVVTNRIISSGIGDVDGDGLDEVLIAVANETFTSNANGTFTTGSVYAVGSTDDALGVLSPTSPLRVLSAEGPSNFGPFHPIDPLAWIGDFDRDGRDDIVIRRLVETLADGGAAFAGVSMRPTEDAKSLSDHDFQVRLVAPERFVEGTTVAFDADLAIADFDGDGSLDLVVGNSYRQVTSQGVPIETNDRGRAEFIWNFDSFVPQSGDNTIQLGNQDVRAADGRLTRRVLTGTQAGERFGTLPRNLVMDFGTDARPDLVIGAAQRETSGAVSSGGALYVVPGSPRRLDLSDPDLRFVDAPVEANRQLPGSDEVLINRGTGQPFEFAGMLTASQSQSIVEFNTLGDGRAGDTIRITEGAAEDANVSLRGVSGYRTGDGAIFTQAETLEVGGVDDKEAVFEFDLNQFGELISDPDAFAAIELTLNLTAGVQRFENVANVTVGENSTYFTASTPETGNELWVTDGTDAGTRLLSDLTPGPTDSVIDHVTVGPGDEVFFTYGNQRQLVYKTDPTGQTFTKVTEFGFLNGEQITTILPHNGRLFVTIANRLYEIVEAGGVYSTITRNSPTNGVNLNAERAHAIGDYILFTYPRLSSGSERWQLNSYRLSDNFSRSLGLYQRFGEEFSPLEHVVNFSDRAYYVADPMTSNGRRDSFLYRFEPSLNFFYQTFSQPNANNAFDFINELHVVDNKLVFFVGPDGVKTLVAPDVVETLKESTLGGTTETSGTAAGGFYFYFSELGSTSRLHRLDPSDPNPNLNPGAIFELNSGQSSVKNFSQITPFGDTVAFVHTDNTGRSTLYIAGENSRSSQEEIAEIVPGSQVSFLNDKLYFRRAETIVDNGGVDVAVPEAAMEIPVGSRIPVPAGSNAAVTADLLIDVLAGSGDERITDFDFQSAAAQTLTRSIDSSDQSQQATFDLQSIVAAKLAAGETTLRLRVRSANPAMTVSVASASAENASELSLRRVETGGVVFDIVAGDGRVIEEGVSAADWSQTDAGKYFLRVRSVEPLSGTQTINYAIELTPPIQGAARAATDRDVIDGGDGRDLLIGDGGQDRLFGGGGVDGFVAEPFELRDAAGDEVLRVESLGSRLSKSRLDRSVRLADVPDAELRRRLLDAVGRSGDVGKKFSLDAAPLTSVELARLTDLSFRSSIHDTPIADLSGLELATSLIRLDLGGVQRQPGTAKVIYVDDFEGPAQWTVDPQGTDTATDGQWDQGDPGGTTYQVEDALSGSSGWFTGLDGANDGIDDLDNGATSVASPPIQLPSADELGDATLELDLWYTVAWSAGAGTDDDEFRIDLILGNDFSTPISLLDIQADGVARGKEWLHAFFDLTAYAGESIQILVTADVQNSASGIFEAGLDRVRIQKVPGPFDRQSATPSLSLDELKSLRNLRHLSLGGQPIEDVSPLETLRSLTTLDISDTSRLQDLSPVLNLPELVYLDASGNRIEEMLAADETDVASPLVELDLRNNPLDGSVYSEFSPHLDPSINVRLSDATAPLDGLDQDWLLLGIGGGSDVVRFGDPDSGGLRVDQVLSTHAAEDLVQRSESVSRDGVYLDGHLYVTDASDGLIRKIHEASGLLVATSQVPRNYTGITTSGGMIYASHFVSNQIFISTLDHSLRELSNQLRWTDNQIFSNGGAIATDDAGNAFIAFDSFRSGDDPTIGRDGFTTRSGGFRRLPLGSSSTGTPFGLVDHVAVDLQWHDGSLYVVFMREDNSNYQIRRYDTFNSSTIGVQVVGGISHGVANPNLRPKLGLDSTGLLLFDPGTEKVWSFDPDATNQVLADGTEVLDTSHIGNVGFIASVDLVQRFADQRPSSDYVVGGRVTLDTLAETGIAATRVYVDVNGIPGYQPGEDPSTITGPDGHYEISWTDPSSSGSEFFVDTVSSNLIGFPGSTFGGVDVFQNLSRSYAIELGGDRQVDEGDVVMLSAIANGVSFNGWVVTPHGQTDPIATSSQLSFDFVPAQSGVYVASASAQGGDHQDQILITVSDVDPLIDDLAVTNGSTGVAFEQTVQIIDPGEDAWQVDINFGDGSPTETLDVNPDGSFLLSHIYQTASDPAFPLSITVRSPGEAPSTRIFPITVNPLAPDSSLALDTMSIVEGGVVRATIDLGNVAAVIESDGWNATLDWGDGSLLEIIDLDTLALSHRYANDDGGNGYLVTLRVTGPEGQDVVQTRSVNVANVAPVLTDDDFSAPQTVTEGQTFAILADGFDVADDQLRYAVNFGDETVAEITSVDAAIFRHAYAMEGTYTVSIDVFDDVSSQSQAVMRDIVVTNAAPQFVPASLLQAIEGQTTGMVHLGTVQDAGDTETISYQIDWGDGSDVVSGTLDLVAGDGFAAADLFASHVYGQSGTYLAKVTVTDAGDLTSEFSFAIVVQNVAPSFIAVPEVVNLREDEAFDVSGGITLSDPAFGNATRPGETYQLRIDWGDGTPVDVVVATIDQFGAVGVDTLAVADLMHAYSDDGRYTVMVEVTDADGGRVTTQFVVQVDNVGPTVDGVPVAVDAALGELFSLPDVTADDIDADTVRAVVRSSDGTTRAALVRDGDVVFDFVPKQAGNQMMTLVVSDEDGGESSETFELRVSASASVDVALPLEFFESSTTPLELTLSGFSTVGADPVTIDIDWGDGTSDPLDSTNLATLLAGGSITSTHIFDDDEIALGNPLIRILATDDQGAVTVIASQSIRLLNADPIASLSTVGPVNEGSTAVLDVTNATDASDADAAELTFSYDFNNDGDFGDAGELRNVTTTSVTIPAMYLGNDPDQTIRVRVADDDGGFTDLTTTVVVNNVPPQVPVGDNMLAFAGRSAAWRMTIDDPGHETAWIIRVDWNGDGDFDDAVDQQFTTADRVFEIARSFDESLAGADIPVTVEVSDGTDSFTDQFIAQVRIPDATAPQSQVEMLPASALSLTFPINITGSDPNGPPEEAVAGISHYELFVSVDGGDFVSHAIVPAEEATIDFTGESNRTYFFYSVAHDLAGNTETTPTTSDTQISVADLDVPETSVSSATPIAGGRFRVDLLGTDGGQSGLAFIDLYVSVDGGVAQLVRSISPGDPGSSGVYTAQVDYQGLTDGIQHVYRFFSVGRDGNGNIEPAPPRDHDVIRTETFESTALLAVGIDVQLGAQQRSYIRQVDVLFNNDDGLSDLLLQNPLSIERFNLDATDVTPGTGTEVGGFAINRIDDRLRIDFGTAGITGDPLSATGNGLYRVRIDGNGDGDFDDDVDVNFEFARIYGDASGDAIVDANDVGLIQSQIGRNQPNLNGDVNGSGEVNTDDLIAAFLQSGQELDSSLRDLLDD